MRAAWERALGQPVCKHGVPTKEICEQCNAGRRKIARERPVETRLTEDVTRLNVSRREEPLLLPPRAHHEAYLTTARGIWTVTCRGCPAFRIRSSDRHDVEAAWGSHRSL